MAELLSQAVIGRVWTRRPASQARKSLQRTLQLTWMRVDLQSLLLFLLLLCSWLLWLQGLTACRTLLCVLHASALLDSHWRA